MATERRGGSVWRRLLAALDEAPEPHWVSQLVHHGSRVALLALTALVIHALFPAPRVSDVAVLERGGVAPNDVIAEFTFDIPKTPDELLREQVEAASGVPPVYVRNAAVRDSVLRGVRAFFTAADSISGAPATEREDALRTLIDRNRISANTEAVEALADPDERAVLRRSIEAAIAAAYAEGIAPSTLGQGVSAVRVRAPEGVERIVPRDSLLTADRFFGMAVGELPPGAAHLAELQRLILIRYFHPSLVFDEAATEAARDRARAAVDPVKATVLEGEKIIGAHERVDEEQEARLQAYEAELSSRGLGAGQAGLSLARSLGAILYNALVIGLLGALLFFFRRSMYGDARAVLLLTALILTVCGSGAVIARLGLPVELIPVTFAALIVAVLWDGRLGFSLALLLALLLAGQTPFLGVTAPFTIALAGAAAAFSVRVVERRSKTWLFIAIISVAYVAAAVTMGLMRSRSLDEIVLSAAYGVANAIVASLLAIGFLPLLESFTGITTDQTLLELSDPNRKLLKRLSLEAPGTYAHTVSVANLAEAACHAIGANGLLARVGAYYHDIGKLVKPQYFIENQPRGRNPHDKLRPAMSATIIRSHVQEGLKLVEAEHLPAAVRRFIPEHHGTQQIAFFYNRAKEDNPGAHLNPADFTYPGPRPQTKETAVLMLADAVESAARAPGSHADAHPRAGGAARDAAHRRRPARREPAHPARDRPGEGVAHRRPLGDVPPPDRLPGRAAARARARGGRRRDHALGALMPDRSITAQAQEGLTVPVELEELEAIVASVLDAEGVDDAELSIALLSDGEIASLNEEYLSHDGPTDVITFPLHRPGGSPLGDVYIGAEQAARQAEEAGVGYREEILRLAVHGTLHVLGYEHPDEGADRERSPMYLRQEELLAAFLARGSDRGGARG